MGLTEVHTDVLNLILARLPADDLAALGAASHFFHQVTIDEVLWRELALTDWPWFFWTGKCEKSPHTYHPPSLGDLVETSDADESAHVSFMCPYRHSVRPHPGIPLPSSYREAYILIAK
ncbi:hypothetical protein SeLEV6574_g07180, partial [Synchytrium endobioticum]